MPVSLHVQWIQPAISTELTEWIYYFTLKVNSYYYKNERIWSKLNLEQAEIKLKEGLHLHIVNFVTPYQLLTVKCMCNHFIVGFASFFLIVNGPWPYFPYSLHSVYIYFRNNRWILVSIFDIFCSFIDWHYLIALFVIIFTHCVIPTYRNLFLSHWNQIIVCN